MALILGIDSGGTHTDGVLFDGEKGGIVGRSKVGHGKEGHMRGVVRCLRSFPPETLNQVERVVFATTLGMNGWRAKEGDAFFCPAEVKITESAAREMQEFVAAMGEALVLAGMTCPVYLGTEGGGLCLLAAASSRDIFLSGPVASLNGAFGLSGEENAYMLDIGGASTQIGGIAQGRENLPGADDLASFNWGGDSRIRLSQEGEISFGPEHAWPLSQVGREDNGFFAEMSAFRNAMGPLLKKGYPFGLLALNRQSPPLFASLTEGPKTVAALAATGVLPGLAEVEEWIKTGALMPVAFTPGDFFHVNGGYVEGSREAAYLGAELLGEICDLAPLAFTQYGLDQLGGILRESLHRFCPGFFNGEKRTLIAVGAAAGTWLHFISLGGGGKILLPPCGEVAGAVGAAIG